MLHPNPPIVLIHGWGFGPSAFDGFTETLARKTNVLTPALSGYGENVDGGLVSQPQEVLDLHVRTVVESIGTWDHLRLPTPASTHSTPAPAIIVGWSMGGLVALRLAQLHPEWVDHVVLLTSLPRFMQAEDWPAGWTAETSDHFQTLLNHDPQAAIRRLALLSSLGDANAPMVRRQLLKSTSSASPNVLMRDMRLLMKTDLRHLMRTLARPIRCLLGEGDQVIGPHSQQALAALLPHAAITTVPGTGHAPFLSQPERIANYLLSIPS